MQKFVSILTSLFLMSLSACSGITAQKNQPPAAEIRTVTKIERPAPPSELTQPCERPGSSDFNILIDVLNDRQDWIKAWERCEARYKTLINWNLGKQVKYLTQITSQAFLPSDTEVALFRLIVSDSSKQCLKDE
jgi:hypothetical protein